VTIGDQQNEDHVTTGDERPLSEQPSDPIVAVETEFESPK
jgi:hypothetical protein